MSKQPVKTGAEWLGSDSRRYGVELPFAVGALIFLSPQISWSAYRLGRQLGHSPFFRQWKDGVWHRRLQTLGDGVTQDPDSPTMGAIDKRVISDDAQKARFDGRDEGLQLLQVLDGSMDSWGIRALLLRDYMTYKRTVPKKLYQQWSEEIADARLDPALTGRSAAWRRTTRNSLSPAANIMSIVLDQESLRYETRQSEVESYRTVQAIRRGKAQWPVSDWAWDQFEAWTQIDRFTAARNFGMTALDGAVLADSPAESTPQQLWTPSRTPHPLFLQAEI